MKKWVIAWCSLMILACGGLGARKLSSKSGVESYQERGVLLLSSQVIGSNFNESAFLNVEVFDEKSSEMVEFTKIKISGFGTGKDFGETGTIHMLDFPPGSYAISSFKVDGGNHTQVNGSPINISFNVMEGFVNYIGEFKLDKQMNWGPSGQFQINIGSSFNRDYEAFQEKHPQLTDMKVLKQLARKF